MASFRTGFKIFGEISLKQGLGRIRSFSEDKKPVQWLPEDQWAVRQPGSTCPDLCAKKKKPPKPSKSWLSLCKDPDAPKDPECDVRHNNCPPPPVKDTSPWYSLGKLIPKKKPSEKPPPLQSCCQEIRRRELAGEDDEVCDENEYEEDKPLRPPECIPKQACPAPVANISCPLPKELNLMLWCECANNDCSKIPPKCQTDRLPYEEFRPQKIWKAPPFSLPCKCEPTFSFPRCSSSIPFSDFKHVDVPKPLYTRYKSVELSDSHTLFNMVEVQCSEDDNFRQGLSSHIPPPPTPIPLPKEPAEDDKNMVCPEKRVIEAGSRRPVKLKNATKFFFTPKPTKLIERRKYRDRFGNQKCDLPFRTQTAKDESDDKEDKKCKSSKTSCGKSDDPPKVIPHSPGQVPHVYEGNLPRSAPPRWMFALCKPGSKDCPLVPRSKDSATEPNDWCSETDGLKFYDGDNEKITPKPPPAPVQPPTPPPPPPPSSPPSVDVQSVEPDSDNTKCRFVLMPEKYNIKLMRKKGEIVDEGETPTIEKIIEKKGTPTKKCPNSYPPIKENILYDLQRICPEPPLDPSKLNLPCRKPPDPVCPKAPKFYRSISTLTPSALKRLCSVELCKVPMRTECGDSSGKCKARDLTPGRGPCPEPCPGPDCAEIALPCCPKARVPPSCNVKKPLPFCKKKLAPRPSFSECSKDPPPCPKPTECNCWEKGPNKK